MKKINQLFAFALCATVLLSTSCKNDPVDEEIPPTGISLNQITLEVPVRQTRTLIAVLAPSGATGTIEWSSLNPAVASVVNGVVTGESVGSTTVAATCGAFSATCAVTVTGSVTEEVDESLEGSDYFLIALDGISSEKIADKIVADFRVNENDGRFLYIWSATFDPGTSTGPNFYGEVEGWYSLVVGAIGWSGAGFYISDSVIYNNLPLLEKLVALSENPEDYYLHFAYKSQQAGRSVWYGFDGVQTPTKTKGVFVVGDVPFTDAGDTRQPYGTYIPDGEWHYLEIPFTYFAEQGLLYQAGSHPGNVFFILGGPTTGTTVEFDAVFFYKKKQ
ncbi:MAG: Ig-like domain-containing protein [Prevotellaceae bacterium]|jgi:hypothetical protein|nr:Ig-like domain-containing protein [Prevotellaceae bacterium]